MQIKKSSVVGVWIFSGTTQSQYTAILGNLNRSTITQQVLVQSMTTVKQELITLKCQKTGLR